MGASDRSYGDIEWDGEPISPPLGYDNDFTNRNATFMAWNLMHTARMLKDNGGIRSELRRHRRGRRADLPAAWLRQRLHQSQRDVHGLEPDAHRADAQRQWGHQIV